MQDEIYIRDELVLETHPDRPYVLLRRKGEAGSVQVRLNEVRYLSRRRVRWQGRRRGWWWGMEMSRSSCDTRKWP